MVSQLTYTKSEQFDGLEVVIVPSGQAFCTQSSFSRFTGKPKQTISDWANKLEIVEIPDISEFGNLSEKPDKLIKTKIELQSTGNPYVVLVPANVFGKWLVKCGHPLADEMFEAGATQFLYKVAGYEIGVKEEKPKFQTPQTYIEALRALLESEEQKEKIRKDNELLQLMNTELEEDVEKLTEVVDELHDYSSIIRIAKFNNVSENNFSWRKLKAQSTLLGVEIKKAPCPRFVTKNLYSHQAWEAAYPDVALPSVDTLTFN